MAGKGKKKGKDKRPKPERLDNLVVEITLKVKKSYTSGNFFTRLFGSKIEEDFNPIIVAETLLRGFHHAKFKRITKISADGEALYEAKNNGKDIKDIIQILKDEEFEGTLLRHVKIDAEQRVNLTAEIDIRRVHSKRNPPIMISLNGKIYRDNLDRLISYIKKHLPIEDLSY